MEPEAVESDHEMFDDVNIDDHEHKRKRVPYFVTLIFFVNCIF